METATTFGHVSGLGIYSRPSEDFDPYDEVYARFESMVGRLEPMRRQRRRSAAAPRPSVLDRRPGLRPRLPHPPSQPGPARAGRPARRADLPHRRPTDGPHPSAVGGLRHRRPGERTLGTAHQVPPRHDRRGVRRDDADDDPRPDARRAAAGREPAVAPASPCRATWSSYDWRWATWPATRPRQCGPNCGSPATWPKPPASRASAPRPARRVRPSRRSRRRSVPATATASASRCRARAHRRLRGTSRSRRTAASPCARPPCRTSSALKDATGGTVNDVVMAIFAGALREYLADARRASGSTIAGDGAGVDPHRRRGRHVDQPGLGPRRRPPHRQSRPHRARAALPSRRWMRPSGSSSSSRPRRWPTSHSLASPVVATSAIRLASQLRLADRVQSPVNVVISNVPGPRQPLYFSGAPARAVHPGVDDRRGHGPEHHGAQLPRRARRSG